MRLILILVVMLDSAIANAETRCYTESRTGEYVCRNTSSGSEVRCYNQGGEMICTNNQGIVVKRCYMVGSEQVCR